MLNVIMMRAMVAVCVALCVHEKLCGTSINPMSERGERSRTREKDSNAHRERGN